MGFNTYSLKLLRCIYLYFSYHREYKCCLHIVVNNMPIPTSTIIKFLELIVDVKVI